MSYPHVVLDANVIVQGRMRDLLLDAAAAKLCRVRWTEAILVEAQRTFIGDLGRDHNQVDALLAAMRRHFPRAAITGYESLVNAMTNDPKDRHVAAAAVQVGANVVTFNLRHFRPEHLAPFGVNALSPDAFLVDLYDVHSDSLAGIVREQAAQRQNPSLSVAAYLASLATLLPRFVAAMQAYPE